jgi:hypothetical protein
VSFGHLRIIQIAEDKSIHNPAVINVGKAKTIEMIDVPRNSVVAHPDDIFWSLLEETPDGIVTN